MTKPLVSSIGVQVWHIACPPGQVFDSTEAACTELEEERVALDTGRDIVTIRG